MKPDNRFRLYLLLVAIASFAGLGIAIWLSGGWNARIGGTRYELITFALLMIGLIALLWFAMSFFILGGRAEMEPSVYRHRGKSGKRGRGSLAVIYICKSGAPPSRAECNSVLEADPDVREGVHIRPTGGPGLPDRWDDEGTQHIAAALVMKKDPQLINEEISYAWSGNLLVIKVFKT